MWQSIHFWGSNLSFSVVSRTVQLVLSSHGLVFFRVGVLQEKIGLARQVLSQEKFERATPVTAQQRPSLEPPKLLCDR